MGFEVSKWGLTPVSGDLGPIPSEQGSLFPSSSPQLQVFPQPAFDLPSVDAMHRAKGVQSGVWAGRKQHYGEPDAVELYKRLDGIWSFGRVAPALVPDDDLGNPTEVGFIGRVVIVERGPLANRNADSCGWRSERFLECDGQGQP